MSVDVADALALVPRYRLRLAVQPPRGLPGDHLARAAGSSIEFHDFRHYVPGDDPRHIDWAAVARTDQLIVRLHRAEVRLSVEILLDASRSLERKAARAVQCACFLAALARKAGARTTVWTIDDAATALREDIEKRLPDVAFEGRVPLPACLERGGLRLEIGSIRIVISDFLFPHDPLKLQGLVGSGAGAVAMLQLLAADEERPAVEGGLRLVDVETAEERELVVNEEIVRQYRERLGRLQEGLSSVCRATRGTFIRLLADETLEALCRGPLVSGGLIEPVGAAAC
ncbi:MAG: DUF58 domain-containing protein [Planctomycetes bacterium]|nr:DUF58 domain-containing protein [Planctomycetota bacterium]